MADRKDYWEVLWRRKLNVRGEGDYPWGATRAGAYHGVQHAEGPIHKAQHLAGPIHKA